MEKVTLIKTGDRSKGATRAIEALGFNPAQNKDVLIKPNFNTADRTPGSTHNDTLAALIDQIWAMGAKSISLGERSYPMTREVMAQKKVLPMLAEKQVRVIDFDELAEKDWIEFKPERSHWKNGFRIARPIIEAECLVSTGCLKTHQFGGVITLSLKLHVGVVPTFRNGFPYMQELHQSPHQQEMIAELNAPFSPDIVLLDGVEAFVDGGPATGKRSRGEVFLASRDRVAIDAVGVAVLKHLGSNREVMDPSVFEQRQIARAVALGIGVTSPSEIDLVAVDKESAGYRDAVQALLSA